jgi:hypothetical protein
MILQHTWVSKLFGYQFTVEFKPGLQNVTSDALSLPEFELMDQFCQVSLSLPEILTKRAEIAVGMADKAWSLVDSIVIHNGRIFLPPSSALWPVVVEQAHGMGHEGVQKTLHCLRVVFFMPHDNKLVCEFIARCTTYQRNKAEHLHLGGLLQPLTVPDTVWSDISMDFVEGFLKVGGKSVVLTVVDRFSMYGHFIALKHPYTAASVAKAFFDQIVRLHGLPTSIVSDRDPVFTSWV